MSWISDIWNYLVRAFQDQGNRMTHTSNALTGFDPGGDEPEYSIAYQWQPDNSVNSIGNSIAGDNPDDVALTNTSGNTSAIDSAFDNVVSGSSSLSNYINENPGLSGEDYMKHMASVSDEWAEKLVDYYLERDSIAEANRYTAEREDTAYQRLTADLRAAGLNPALLYGGSASIGNAGSAGIIRQTEGANSRSISNFDKIKKLMLAYMVYTLSEKEFAANSIFKSFNSMSDFLKLLF